jgi:hypothetical protein
LETTVLNQGLYPSLKALDMNQAWLHALPKGCNRRWSWLRIVPAVFRQQMGHTGAMTRRYSGAIPLEQIVAAYSPRNLRNPVELEKWKMKLRRNCLILWSGLSESNRHLNLGKARFSHLRRWNGGTYRKFDNS